MARYKAEGRDKVRKAKNIAKAEAEAKIEKVMNVPRGSTRAARRSHLQREV